MQMKEPNGGTPPINQKRSLNEDDDIHPLGSGTLNPLEGHWLSSRLLSHHERLTRPRKTTNHFTRVAPSVSILK